MSGRVTREREREREREQLRGACITRTTLLLVSPHPFLAIHAVFHLYWFAYRLLLGRISALLFGCVAGKYKFPKNLLHMLTRYVRNPPEEKS